jgi:His-Xaa-Ser system radical SAM maturase HxsC
MKLSARTAVEGLPTPIVARIATAPVTAEARAKSILIAQDDVDLDGYAAIVSSRFTADVPRIEPCADLAYLSDGDVVAVSPDGIVRVLYRRKSRHNFLFVTDRCNSYCLMCSQPPKEVDDLWRVEELHRVIDLIDPETSHLGLTGGEPTLLGADFVDLIDHCRRALPDTALHVLTNGRAFAKRSFTNAVAAIAHSNLTLAIPLYSDGASEHDYVVQAAGAFDETVAGLLNLAAAGVEVEIRIVVHRQTSERLPFLAEFISRNLPFAAHVAIMGLEITGFTVANLDVLWIDPVDYQPQLRDTVRIIASAGIPVSIYNHPLCVIPRDLWSFARQSISDWKNVYATECESCAVRAECGGFFQSSSIRRTRGIQPIP